MAGAPPGGPLPPGVITSSLPPPGMPPPDMPPPGVSPPPQPGSMPPPLAPDQGNGDARRSRSHSRSHKRKRSRERKDHRSGRHKKEKKQHRSSHRPPPPAAPPDRFFAGYRGPQHAWYPPVPGAPPGWHDPRYHYGLGGPPPNGQNSRSSQMADDGVSTAVSERFLMRNDYCQNFVDKGVRPQNFIRDLDYESRYSEYPKIERLITLKDNIIGKRATPGMSLICDLKTYDLSSLGVKFDVILMDPPWEEYSARVMGLYAQDEDLEPWSFEEISNLRIPDIAEPQSFFFLWCGETHLEQARVLFRKWGYRRVEDVCWVKTNRNAKVDDNGKVEKSTLMYEDQSLLVRTKEHCLVGVRGSLKRSEDTHFIHANCDTDVIIQEEETFGSTVKPTELYEIIEHFCLGRRRIELFGCDRNMRDGWLTVGRKLTTSNWNRDMYHSWFEGEACWPNIQDFRGGTLLGSIAEIDELRPKSPVRPERPTRSIRGRKEDEERLLPEDLGELAANLPESERGDSIGVKSPGIVK